MKEEYIEFTKNTVSTSPQSPPAPPGLPLDKTDPPRGRATPQTWSLIKADYLIGKGSLRALAAHYSVSDSTVMKRAGREHWAAHRALASTQTDATVVATMQQRAEDFVHRSAEQTDRFLTRVSESEAILEPEDRKGLRLLASTLKDVVAVGRDTYQLGGQDGQGRCIVNLAFLQEYEPAMPKSIVES